MNEIIFVVEQALKGGLTARALGEFIFSEADTGAELRLAVRDAVHCHLTKASRQKSSGCISFVKNCWLRKRRLR